MSGEHELDAPRPRVRLIGQDPDALFILGLCLAVGRQVGWDDARLIAFFDEATSDDYAHLISTVHDHFEIE